MTRRLAENVARLCAVLPIKHVAQHYRLGWDAVKQIDKAWLQRSLGPVDLRGVTQLVMDEFALHTGHHYATVIAEIYDHSSSSWAGLAAMPSKRWRWI